MASESDHHGDVRTALINAALQLIRELGADGFTLRDVARRSGVSHNALLRHFRDKSDLIAAIAEDGFVLLAAAMEDALFENASPRQRLASSGRAYVALALRRPEHFAVMFSTVFDANRHPAARAAGDRAFLGLVALVTAAQEAGQLRRGDPVRLAYIVWSQVHGVATLATGDQFPMRTQREILELTDQATQAVLAGLL